MEIPVGAAVFEIASSRGLREEQFRFYEVIPESVVVAPAPIKVQETEDDGPVDALDAAIVRHIERALAATGGQIEGGPGAAKMLGINPHTLRAKMRKLKIDWDRFRRY